LATITPRVHNCARRDGHHLTRVLGHQPVCAATARGVQPAAEDLAHIQAGLAEVAAGKGVEVTPEELAEWERTGELPASVEARLAACG